MTAMEMESLLVERVEILTHKVSGARDIAIFYLIELVHPETWETEKKIFLAPVMTAVEMSNIVVKRLRPTRSTVHVITIILISLNFSTQTTLETNKK